MKNCRETQRLWTGALLSLRPPCSNMTDQLQDGLVYYIHKYSFKLYEVLDLTLYFNCRRLNCLVLDQLSLACAYYMGVS
jgi:hypothetical protein